MASSNHRRLIAKIVAAQNAKARARRFVTKMGRHLVELLAQAHALGMSDKAVARAVLRHQHGKFTRAEWQREFERIRKCRRRGTHGPTVSTVPPVQSPSEGVPSTAEVSTMARLVKRITTTTEEYGPDVEDAETKEDECADDERAASAAEGEDADVDDDDEEDDEDEDE